MTNSNQNISILQSEEKSTEVIHLDYTLKSPDERIELVNKILQQNPSLPSHKYLDILADYILDARTKAEKKDKTILTNNRLVTVNKRETSYEGLVSKFENGEDGVSNLAVIDGKSAFLSPHIEITAADIEEIPGLKDLRDQIKRLEAELASAAGKRKYYLKKAIIEMRRDQYTLKQIFKQPIFSTSAPRENSLIDLDEHIYIDENGEPVSDGLINLFNPIHISAILCNYDLLKSDLRQKFNNDFYYLMEDFDKYAAATLESRPLYKDLVDLKIKGKTNQQIQSLLLKKYNKQYSIEYISALWRKKIPRLIAEKAKKEYLVWHYTFVERGKWKKCSKCGQIKLAHPRFFSKNNTSKDGFYSICKECRNKKGG